MTTIENRYANEVYAELGVRPVVNAAATLTSGIAWVRHDGGRSRAARRADR